MLPAIALWIAATVAVNAVVIHTIYEFKGFKTK